MTASLTEKRAAKRAQADLAKVREAGRKAGLAAPPPTSESIARVATAMGVPLHLPAQESEAVAS